ncbi:MAG: type II toxin-antitoxin system RelE/ParE family toxin [Azoarcus sp.]|jgi:mRNA interferase RelE/StbE|nr:type II toxin-antitoxin system RelE/ParE family toxin [Azoarcus sp.]
MYQIEYTHEALKVLRALPRNVSDGLRGKIRQLADNPFAAANVKKLVGREGYRLRVGDWRVVYQLDCQRLVVQVLTISPRGGAYK